MLDNFISRHTHHRHAPVVNQRPQPEVFYKRPKGPISDFVIAPRRSAAPVTEEPVVEEVLETETPVDYHAYHVDAIFVQLAAIEAEDRDSF